MKHTCIVQVEVDESSILSRNDIMEYIEGSIISTFNEVNRDKWNHKLVTMIGITKLSRSEESKIREILNLNDLESNM